MAEQFAKSQLRKVELIKHSGNYIDRLLRFGLLLRSGSRLRFTYPIIQEYLAACWMVREEPELVEGRFRYAVYRPWAQAIQFCLEVHPDAERIIRLQLQQPDDVFHTVLRLIGRCIVNGAVVSQTLKLEVGDMLADAWPCESWQISERIGRLIADGFTAPLPTKAEGFLVAGEMLSFGAGSEIITAKNDKTLTIKALKSYLTHDLEHQPWLHGWQKAVNQISDEALRMYVSRSREEHTSDRELASISNLIDQLPRNIPLIKALQKIAADTTLPVLIRVAGYNCCQYPIDKAAMHLIMPFLKPVDCEVDYWEELHAAHYFWKIEGADQEYLSLVGDSSVNDRIINNLTEKLVNQHAEEINYMEILQAAQKIAEGGRHFRIKLMCAVAGDKVATSELIDKLTEVPDQIAALWCWHINHFNEDECNKALEKLKNRQPLSEEPISLISTLLTGLTYKMGPSLSLSGVLDQAVRHPAYSQFSEWISDFLLIEPLSPNEKIKAFLVQKDLGYEIIQEKVVVLLEQIWADFLTIDDENEAFEQAWLLHNCIDLLEVKMYGQCKNILHDIVLMSSFNASSAAISALAIMGDEQELEWMTEKYSEIDKNLSSSILYASESLAIRLGKRVVRDGNRLKVKEW